jgi:hypothetical protein
MMRYGKTMFQFKQKKVINSILALTLSYQQKIWIS